MQAIGGFKQLLFPGTSPVPQMQAAIGNVEQGQQTEFTMGETEIMQVIGIVARLQQHDPNIVQHLDKLATIAETKPKMFQMLLTSLDGI